ALIQPGGQAADVVALKAALARLMQTERKQICIIQPRMSVAGAGFTGEALQAACVEPWNQDRTLHILEETAVLLGNGGALFGSDAEYRQERPFAVEQRSDLGLFVGVQGAPDQRQSAAPLRALFDQGEALGYGKL